MKRTAIVIVVLLVAAAIVGGIRSTAQQSPPLPTPFDIVGHIEKFELNSSEPGLRDELLGAKIVVNGIEVIIPRNTIINFPAAVLTPKDIFDLAPKGTVQGSAGGNCLSNTNTQPASGLALTDCLPPNQSVQGEVKHHPYAAYEVSITGNIMPARIVSGIASNEIYVAGMVSISQQSLNGANGIVLSATDGVITLKNGLAVPGVTPPVSRVKINATSGIFGMQSSIIDVNDDATKDAQSKSAFINTATNPFPATVDRTLTEDGRFSADVTNATIHTETGYPMCIPNSGTDSEVNKNCPSINRPMNGAVAATNFLICKTCPPDNAPDSPAKRRMTRMRNSLPPWIRNKICRDCDPTKPGDYINFSGTLAKDGVGFYISAHTISSPVGIFTAPGESTSYIAIDLSIYGTGGEPFVDKGEVLSQENSPRGLKFEGFSTDPFATIDIYAIDRNPTTGAKSLRYLMFAPSDPAVLSRFRHSISQTHALPAPREILAVNRAIAATHGLIAPAFASTRTPLGGFGCSVSTPIVKNSDLEKWIDGKVTINGVEQDVIPFGVYTSPLSEYIFPEGRNVGETLPPYNFDDIDFLVNGFGPLDTRGREAAQPVVGRLAPWPDITSFVSFRSTTGTLTGCGGIGGGASSAICRRLSQKQCEP
jgi:hypothetical protein